MLENGERRKKVTIWFNYGVTFGFVVSVVSLVFLFTCLTPRSPGVLELEERQEVAAAQSDYQSGGIRDIPLPIPPANYLEDVQWLLMKMDAKDGQTLTPEELAYAKATFTGHSVAIIIMGETGGRYHRTVELSHDQLLVRRDALGDASINLTTRAIHELRPAIEVKDKVEALKVVYRLRDEKELFIEGDFLRKLAMEGSVVFLKSLI